MPFTPPQNAQNALMDAALSLQLRRVWRRLPDDISLSGMFPSLSSKDIRMALDDSVMLLASASTAGRQALSTGADITAIVFGLRKRHPGFSDEGYLAVINFGCFLAR